jgi:hypothetical protein
MQLQVKRTVKLVTEQHITYAIASILLVLSHRALTPSQR